MRIRSPLEFANGHACLKIQQADRLEDERLSDLVALGMPTDGQVRLTIKGEFFDPAFAGYTLELYGFWPEDLEPNRRDQRIGAPDHTLVNYPSEASGYIFKACYYFWLQRVRYGNETVRELSWHPDVRDYLSIKRNVWVKYSEPARALLRHVQQRGRREGTGYFKSDASFINALSEVLRDQDRRLSESKGLYFLSRNQFWQAKPLTMRESQARTKTLRNWLTRCGLTWDQAKGKYC
ncbi:MAG: hypothetical protein AABO57_09720 [Acidobacteriota bacterium]